MKKEAKPKFFAPEVIQTSAMDCGPASVKAVLQGYGIKVNFDRLRERCQTDVDGTSLGALETIANEMGLQAESILVPKDSLTLKEADCLPAIVFTNTPAGLHYIVVWSVLGSRVQIMDPGVGRSWIHRDRLLERVAPLFTRMPEEQWRDWAGSEDGQKPLVAKLRDLGMSSGEALAEVRRGDLDPSWKTYAMLDAGVRMVRTLINAGALPRGRSAVNLFRGVVQDTLVFLSMASDPKAIPPIPREFWSVIPLEEGDLRVNGAILLYISGRSEPSQRKSLFMDAQELSDSVRPIPALTALGRPSSAFQLGVPALRILDDGADDDLPTMVGNATSLALPKISGAENKLPVIDAQRSVQMSRMSAMGRMSQMGRMSAMGRMSQLGRASTLGRMSQLGRLPQAAHLQQAAASPNPLQNRASTWFGAVVPADLTKQLQSDEVKPLRVLFETMRLDSKATIGVTLLLVVLGVAATSLDALLMRGLSDIMGRLTLGTQRTAFLVVMVVFLLLALAFESVRLLATQRLGRGLEARLRVAFMEKLPRLEDRYLRSRAASDMVSRAHLLASLRGVPAFLSNTLSTVLGLFATLGLLLWVHPPSLVTALVILVVSAVVPLIAFKPLNEYAAKLATQDGGLFRFYLDALVGIVPIRVHGAERVVRREHEGLLTEWTNSNVAYEKRLVGVNAVTSALGIGMTALLVYTFVRTGGDPRSLLLIVYFAQRLPGYASALVRSQSMYAAIRQNAMRLFEPLAAAETNVPDDVAPGRRSPRGVSVQLSQVDVVASGRTLLEQVNLDIPSGSHIAIVGQSGAGKSTLLSVLLGWLSTSSGRILIDGQPLDAAVLGRLRQETAWVDPGIQLWNTHLIGNILYGNSDRIDKLGMAAEQSDVLELLERLPDGFTTELGEGGAKVSGGQGQRVRLARAMMRDDARLVLLDEPFRGLERDRRRALLKRARSMWRNATILFVSHDVADTVEFERVLVVNDGKIAEDGHPQQLLASSTIYRSLVDADRAVREEVWDPKKWRKLRVDRGTVVEEGGGS